MIIISKTIDSINLKKFAKKLDFVPKDNSFGIFFKKYFKHNDYIITIDFEKKLINFGNKINSGRKTTQNFSQEENFVVLECVNRLLEKGYNPQDLILEQKFTVGHGASGGWLDILVLKEKKAFLMIECKTFGKEYEKELCNINKNGGQLFTYFQQDTNANYLMLYTSKFEDDKIIYLNEIIKIENHYKGAGNIIDFYGRWNKITKQNGIFENWVKCYDFESKAIIKDELKPLTQEDSRFVFAEFLSILRKHSISDKPNAFNKIFNLFLSKIFDEKKKKNEELYFQWKEGEDNDVNFQIRLINLYKDGMFEFLKKEIEGISNEDFNYKDNEDLEKKKKKWLKFNNVFAIKEVIDDESFEDNAIVLKEVVELLQNFQIRYPRKQQHLSDFFERLLTTGLKQESGQYFTPPPITRFIIKSLPIKKCILEKLKKGNSNDLLPTVIDYSAGSGHFLTEAMEEIQKVIDLISCENFYDDVNKKIVNWRNDQFDWAGKYIYGIEKDYRLVKVAKVGCYFYGDGLAQVIHGDGLDNFNKSKNYRGLLKVSDKNLEQDNKQFDFVISNPPYSVSSFKGNFKNSDLAKKDFDLYKNLTDQSSEIECLFVERTKQLLKEGGIAGIILPSSILSNTGIYTKTREILLKYFEIISITALGSGTFMATGTNTVILFLRRRNDYDWKNIEASIESFSENLKDVSLNGVENIFSKYVAHSFENISFEDYISIFKKSPNKIFKESEIFKDYKKGIKTKNENDLFNKIIEIEKEKLLYFILAFNQRVVLVKSGEKKVEKEFLGYEFSNRRGSEGIHPIQRGKLIDDCTKLFDANSYDNKEKVSTYIYDAFEGNFDREINENLKEHITRIDLVDMMTFNRVDFEKSISLNVNSKIKIESKWELVKLGDICEIDSGTNAPQGTQYFKNGKVPFIRAGNLNKLDSNFNIIPNKENFVNDLAINNLILKNCKKGTILFPKSGQSVNTNNIGILNSDSYIVNHLASIYSKDKILLKYMFEFLRKFKTSNFKNVDSDYPSINLSTVKDFKIPLPTKEIQKKIVEEIEVLENLQEKNEKRVEELKGEIEEIVEKLEGNKKYIGDENYFEDVFAGGDKPKNFSFKKTFENKYPIYTNAIKENGLFGYTNIFRVENSCVTLSARGTIGFPVARNEKFFPIVRLIVIIPNKNLHFKYLEFALKNCEIQKAGTNIPQLTIPMIKNIEIPLPPLKEQEKIVEKIEKIEKDISKLEEEINEIPKLKEEILKKYL